MAAWDLRYRQPAVAWTEALPVGNGRLGAMVFGGVERERLQLNESTFWAGGPYQPTNPDALPHLEEVRSLIFAGRHEEAEALVNRSSMAKPIKQMSYQPIGDVFGGRVADGIREAAESGRPFILHRIRSGAREALDEPVEQTRLDVLQRHVLNEADQHAQVLAHRAEHAESPQQGAMLPSGADWIGFAGKGPDAHGIAGVLRFVVKARVLSQDGTIVVSADGIRVEGASEALVAINAATSFVRFDRTDADAMARVDARLMAMLRDDDLGLLAEGPRLVEVTGTRQQRVARLRACLVGA